MGRPDCPRGESLHPSSAGVCIKSLTAELICSTASLALVTGTSEGVQSAFGVHAPWSPPLITLWLAHAPQREMRLQKLAGCGRRSDRHRHNCPLMFLASIRCGRLVGDDRLSNLF